MRSCLERAQKKPRPKARLNPHRLQRLTSSITINAIHACKDSVSASMNSLLIGEIPWSVAILQQMMKSGVQIAMIPLNSSQLLQLNRIRKG